MSPKELEELSFRNLVEWHRDDLTKVIGGTRATNLFTEHHSSYLIKYGVLRRGAKNKQTSLTPRAEAVLEVQS